LNYIYTWFRRSTVGAIIIIIIFVEYERQNVLLADAKLRSIEAVTAVLTTMI
jgi:hypothetical protein